MCKTCGCGKEEALIERSRRGSREAYGAIVEMYMKDAYFIALGLVGNREDALDLSQEAFSGPIIISRH